MKVGDLVHNIWETNSVQVWEDIRSDVSDFRFMEPNQLAIVIDQISWLGGDLRYAKLLLTDGTVGWVQPQYLRVVQ